MVFRQGEHDGLARSFLLLWRKLLIALPGQPVELLHHLPVGVLVRPFPLKLGWVESLPVDGCPLRDQMRDPLRESIWSQVALANRRDNREGKVRLPGLALVELEGVPVNVR